MEGTAMSRSAFNTNRILPKLFVNKVLQVDPRENDVLNPSYKGKTVTTYNSHDLEAVLDTKKKMKGKPVVVLLMQSNPTIVKEFEAEVDAIFTHFGMEDKVIMELLIGKFEPSGLLLFQMPANMKTVETQFEDVAHDMECHVDEEGNISDFAFGLNWGGVIEDNRTEK